MDRYHNNVGIDPRDLISARGLTHAQAAEMFGVNVTTVSRWFMSGSNHREPSQPCWKLASIYYHNPGLRG